MVTLSNGTKAEVLRWVGPAMKVRGSMLGVGRDAKGVVVATITGGPHRMSTLSRVRTEPGSTWPPELDEVACHGFASGNEDVDPRTFMIRDDGWLALAAGRSACALRLVEGAAPSIAAAALAALEAGPARQPPAFFSARGGERAGYFVERRRTPSFDQPPESVMHLREPLVHLLLAGLEVGCVVGVMKPDVPAILHRVDGDGRVRQVDVHRTPAGPRNYVVARTGGAWWVSGSMDGGPIHVHKLVGEDLAPEGAPYVLPGEPGDRPFAACALGDRLAVLIGGHGVRVIVTDGVEAIRTDGVVGLDASDSEPMAIASDPACDAIWVARARGASTLVTRADLLASGDPRLDTKPYTELRPSARKREAPTPPAPARPMDPIAAYARNVRVHHLIRSIAGVHYTASGVEHGLSRHPDGFLRTWSIDGSGNHHLVAWNDHALVAFAFDQDSAPADTSALLEDVPPRARPLADALLRSKFPPPNSVAWMVREGGRVHQRSEHDAEELSAYAKPTDDVVERWADHNGVSSAQAALAVRLADASPGYTLTEDDIEAILEPPPEKDEPDVSEQGLARGRNHFEAAGLIWPD